MPGSSCNNSWAEGAQYLDGFLLRGKAEPLQRAKALSHTNVQSIVKPVKWVAMGSRWEEMVQEATGIQCTNAAHVPAHNTHALDGSIFWCFCIHHVTFSEWLLMHRYCTGMCIWACTSSSDWSLHKSLNYCPILTLPPSTEQQQRNVAVVVIWGWTNRGHCWTIKQKDEGECCHGWSAASLQWGSAKRHNVIIETNQL